MASTPLSVTQEATWTLAPQDLPRVDDLVTEDDTPVDNLFCAKQPRLLVEPLYSSWAGPGAGRPFLADANVGMFYSVHQPPLVPDAFLSLDVQAPEDLWTKSHRSYFFWEYGKPPEVVVEVVSKQKGAEAERKLRDYARLGITYYAIFDPINQLQGGVLRIYRLHEGVYRQTTEGWLPMAGIGVTLWQGGMRGLRRPGYAGVRRTALLSLQGQNAPSRNTSVPSRNTSALSRNTSALNAWQPNCGLWGLNRQMSDGAALKQRANNTLCCSRQASLCTLMGRVSGITGCS